MTTTTEIDRAIVINARNIEKTEQELYYASCYIVSWCEYNHYNDSDFYTRYFDPQKNTVTDVETGSTRYAGSDLEYNFRKDWTVELIKQFSDLCEINVLDCVKWDNLAYQHIGNIHKLSIGEIVILQKKVSPRKLVTLKPNKSAKDKLIVNPDTAVTIVKIDTQYERLLVTIDGEIGFWVNSISDVSRSIGTLTRKDYNVNPITAMRNLWRISRWYATAQNAI